MKWLHMSLAVITSFALAVGPAWAMAIEGVGELNIERVAEAVDDVGAFRAAVEAAFEGLDPEESDALRGAFEAMGAEIEESDRTPGEIARAAVLAAVGGLSREVTHQFQEAMVTGNVADINVEWGNQLAGFLNEAQQQAFADGDMQAYAHYGVMEHTVTMTNEQAQRLGAIFEGLQNDGFTYDENSFEQVLGESGFNFETGTAADLRRIAGALVGPEAAEEMAKLMEESMNPENYGEMMTGEYETLMALPDFDIANFVSAGQIAAMGGDFDFANMSPEAMFEHLGAEGFIPEAGVAVDMDNLPAWATTEMFYQDASGETFWYGSGQAATPLHDGYYTGTAGEFVMNDAGGWELADGAVLSPEDQAMYDHYLETGEELWSDVDGNYEDYVDYYEDYNDGEAADYCHLHDGSNDGQDHAGQPHCA